MTVAWAGVATLHSLAPSVGGVLIWLMKGGDLFQRLFPRQWASGSRY